MTHFFTRTFRIPLAIKIHQLTFLQRIKNYTRFSGVERTRIRNLALNLNRMLLPTKGILLLLSLTLLEWSNNFTQILTVLCILQHKLL